MLIPSFKLSNDGTGNSFADCQVRNDKGLCAECGCSLPNVPNCCFIGLVCDECKQKWVQIMEEYKAYNQRYSLERDIERAIRDSGV